MIIAIDVHYRENKAKTVSIEFEDWLDTKPLVTHVLEIPVVAEYVPGQFYKRELPCILEILKLSDLSEVTAIIVDGYVVLDDAEKYGLGGYLYEELKQQIPIVGVAKRSFHSLKEKVIPILRGASKNPLFVTALGGDLEVYAEKVAQMYGDFRIPTLLKILDMETKK